MRKLIFLATLLFGFSVQALAAPETYTLDPAHSYVLWTISHFGFSHPSGKWYANGTVVLDKDKMSNDKVNVTIDINSLDTGNPELDKHLKAPVFFDAGKFPTATYVSNKVVQTGKDTADIYGTLTLHGVSKPVILKTKLNKVGVNPISNKMTAGFSADTTLKRSDFGITTLLPGLGDDVKLHVEVEAAK